MPPKTKIGIAHFFKNNNPTKPIVLINGSHLNQNIALAGILNFCKKTALRKCSVNAPNRFPINKSVATICKINFINKNEQQK